MRIENMILVTETVEKMTWETSEIFEILFDIETKQNFKGFKSIHFEAMKCPEISYYITVPKAKLLKAK